MQPRIPHVLAAPQADQLALPALLTPKKIFPQLRFPRFVRAELAGWIGGSRFPVLTLPRHSGRFTPLVLPAFPLPYLLRVQPPIPAVFAATSTTQQPILPARERRAALHAPQPRRRCPTGGVDTFPVPVTPRTRRSVRAPATPRTPAARHPEVRTELRKRQKLPAARTTPTLWLPHPRPHPTEHPNRLPNPHKLIKRPPLNHRERVSLAKTWQG
jgi:hypothetical protein